MFIAVFVSLIGALALPVPWPRCTPVWCLAYL
jgi:hypothetical protein